MLAHAVWMVYRNQLVYYSADTAYLSIGFAKFFRKFFASAQNVKEGPLGSLQSVKKVLF